MAAIDKNNLFRAIKSNWDQIRWVMTLILTVLIFTALLRHAFDIPTSIVNISMIPLTIILFFYHIGRPTEGKRYKTYIPFMGLPILLLGIWAYFEHEFSAFEPSSILFHITYGVGDVGADATTYNAIFFFLITCLLIGNLSYMGARDKRIAVFEKLLAIPLLVVNPVAKEVYGSLSNSNTAVNLAKQYQPEQSFSYNDTNKKPKNLIWIYMESVEGTFAKGKFAPTMSDLNELRSQGLEIQGIEQIRDTGWTVAGQVATQCGFPLLSLGYIRRNSFNNVQSFLPGSYCLGDLLARQGYNTAYYNGSELGFAGKGLFFQQHGYQIVKGLHELPHKKSYTHKWGLYDDELFDQVYNQILAYSKQNKPYAMVTLTNGAHSPNGHISKRCLEEIPPVSKHQILYSVQCTSYLIAKFIDKLKNNNMLENTLVIVSSDHLMMRNPVTPQLEAKKRENFFLALGDNIKPQLIHKPSTMIDVYPTVLELLGYNLLDRRAGLGVSLLSNKPTLFEQLQKEQIENAILYDKDLRKYVWGLCKQSSCKLAKTIKSPEQINMTTSTKPFSKK